MKARIFAIMVIVAILFSAFGINSARAGAYDTQFTTSVTYLNIGTATTTTLRLYFYADENDTIPTTYDLVNPAAVNAAGSISIGNIGTVDPGFQGSAYLESDQLLLVTLVQVPDLLSQSVVKNRAMSNGFITGGDTALLPTILKATFDTNTIFSVQNADAEINNVTIVFKNLSAATVHTIVAAIQPGAALYVNAAETTELGLTFNGSAIITALREDGTTPGKIVATSMEYNIAGYGVYAWEGFEAGATKVYMPSAMCAKWGQTSYYAVQNTSLTTPTTVTVTFTDQDTLATYVRTETVNPLAKLSVNACVTMPANTRGSAVIDSSATDIVAIGKVSGAGLSTAFNGVAMGAEVLGDRKSVV